MGIGLPELLIILLIVLLLCGPGLLVVGVLLLGPSRSIRTAGELGKIFRAFRDGLSGKDDRQDQP